MLSFQEHIFPLPSALLHTPCYPSAVPSCHRQCSPRAGLPWTVKALSSSDFTPQEVTLPLISPHMNQRPLPTGASAPGLRLTAETFAAATLSHAPRSPCPDRDELHGDLLPPTPHEAGHPTSHPLAPGREACWARACELATQGVQPRLQHQQSAGPSGTARTSPAAARVHSLPALTDIPGPWEPAPMSRGWSLLQQSPLPINTSPASGLPIISDKRVASQQPETTSSGFLLLLETEGSPPSHTARYRSI